MEDSDTESSPLRRRFDQTKSSFFANASDLFIFLCFSLLIIASTALVVFVYVGQYLEFDEIPLAMSILQRFISTLSLTIISATMMMVGKRYVLSKLTRGGIRCRRVAVYSNSSISNIANHLFLYEVELPLLALLIIWLLGLSSALTINDTSKLMPISGYTLLLPPAGPIDPSVPTVGLASAQLIFAASSLCMGMDGTVGLVNVTGTTLTSGGSAGSIYYPPLTFLSDFRDVSPSTITMNGFKISVDQPSSLPSGSQNLSQCVDPRVQMYFAGADNQTISLLVSNANMQGNLYRFNASAVTMGGTLSLSQSYAEFALDGTSSPNVMSSDQWALDMMNIICNTTMPSIGFCTASSQSIASIASFVNYRDSSVSPDMVSIWTTVLGMVMGAYSTAVASTLSPDFVSAETVSATFDGTYLVVDYGVYLLIANIVVSILLLIFAVRLYRATKLGTDFMHPTRLMLDPLKKPYLFDAPLDETIDTLDNPYLVVSEDKELLIMKEK